MIANIIYSRAEEHRGPQLVHHLITKALKESGFQIEELYLSNADCADAVGLVGPGVARRKGIWRLLPKFFVTQKLLSWLYARGVNMVVCDGIGVLRHLLPTLARNGDLKLIVIVHMVARFRPKDLKLLRQYQNRIRVVAVSTWAAKKLENAYPSLGDMLIAIPNTLPTNFEDSLYGRDEARSVLGLPAHKYLIGMAARLAGQKDVGTAIRAFSESRLADSYLVIIGDGPERERLKGLANELGISEFIIWLGWIESASRYMKGFDAYLSTAIIEGFGLSVLEAYASGIPVICTDIPPHREILGDDGVYFSIGNVNECAEKLSLPLNTSSRCDLSLRYKAFSGAYLELIRELSR